MNYFVLFVILIIIIIILMMTCGTNKVDLKEKWENYM